MEKKCQGVKFENDYSANMLNRENKKIIRKRYRKCQKNTKVGTLIKKNDIKVGTLRQK